MRLKKLTIFGFKSFADKLTLDFDADIIGIVGPNGCGKSNIVDAFRWVMGAPARHLRGDIKEDLLFAGSDKKQPCHFAEVSVTLTDVGQELDIDYSEVTITRRLHRSGESEFLLNKHPVRQKDIHNLLMGSGLGKGAFSVFEQGKLDEVINRSSLERRAIFDESAGTIVFLQRKKEALANFAKVEANVLRLQDIHGEVEKQMRTLKRASAAAKDFQEKKAALLLLEKQLLFAKHARALAMTEKLEDEMQQATKEQKNLQNKLEKLEHQLEQKKEATHTEQRLLLDSVTKLSETKNQIQLIEAKTAFEREKQSRLTKQKDQLEQELKTRNQALITLTLSKTENEKKLLTLASALSKAQNEADALVGQKEKIQAALKTSHEQQREAKEALELSYKNERTFFSSWQEMKLRQEGAHEHLYKLIGAKKDKEQVAKELSAAIVRVEKEVGAHQTKIEELKKEQSTCSQKLATHVSTIEQNSAKLDDLQHAIAIRRGHERSLISLQEEFEGFSKGARELLKETKKKTSPLYGRLQGLHQHLSANSGYEKAFSVSMHSYSDTLVVEKEEDLSDVLSFAKETGISDFSILCAEHLAPHSIASPLAAPNRFASHFFQHVALKVDLASALKSAKEVSSKSFVTEDGEFIDGNHVLFHQSSLKEETNTFMREAALAKLKDELETLTKKKEAMDALISKQRIEKNRLESELSKIKEESGFVEMTLAQQLFSFERMKDDLKTYRKELEELELEAIRLKEESQGNAARTTSLEKKHQEVKATREMLEEKQKEFDVAEKALISSFSAESDRLSQAEKGVQKAKSALQAEEHAKEILILKAKEHADAALELKIRLDKLDEEYNASCALTVSFEKKLNDQQLTNESVSTRHKERELSFQEAKLECDSIDKEHKKQSQELEKLRALTQRKALSHEQQKSESEKLKEELLERFQTLESDVPVLDQSQIDKTERQAWLLRVELEKRPAVNEASIAEYTEVESRYQILSEQLKDLCATKTDLETLITSLDRKSRKLFRENFEKVRTAFCKNFAILFNGGEANLHFTDGKDVMASGIEIVAKPPGKQMRSISLLSGGEKCLTALALLFSLFEVKPAPFCILDEVDAPLDDANISRFINVLEQFRSKTQFIIVTHNKKTMAHANILFGVSMEEKGVSRLISLALEKKHAEV